MESLVLLLRGINVGGHNRLPMSDLQAVLAGLGFDDVRTHLQSGNVVCAGPGRPAEVDAPMAPSVIALATTAAISES